MSSNIFKTPLLKGAAAALALLAASSTAMADSTVTLVAGPQSTTLPDGRIVPMWGYTCGDALATPVGSSNATCTAMNGSAQTGTSWQPPLITVPKGSPLTITLVNNLSFTAGANTVPTSIIIDGQLGGGLGLVRTTSPSPAHEAQGTSWPGVRGGLDTSANAITVTSAGSGYSSAPLVSFSGGDGAGAQAVARLAPGPVGSVSVVARGSGYTSVPSVSFAGTGSGAAATAFLGAGPVTITASGQGSYTSATPPVTATFSAPTSCTINTTTCVRATGTVAMTTSGNGGGGANGRRRVASVTVTNPGAGYTAVPTITFSRGTATAAVSSLAVGYLRLDSGGLNYDGAPAVTISGGGGSGATATAALSTGVGSVTVTNAGSYINSKPTISFVGGGGSGAAALVNSLSDFQSAGTPTFTPPAQVDRVRSLATEVTFADGATGKQLTWNNLRPGTYLIHSGHAAVDPAPNGAVWCARRH